MAKHGQFCTTSVIRTLDSSQARFYVVFLSLCQWAGAILRSFWGPFWAILSHLRGHPENPNESQKYRKNSQKRSHSAKRKCTKKVKNGQKSAKIIRKIDFPYNNFPKKAVSLRKCTQKKSPSAKKVFFRAFGATPLRPWGVLYRFLDSVIL